MRHYFLRHTGQKPVTVTLGIPIPNISEAELEKLYVPLDTIAEMLLQEGNLKPHFQLWGDTGACKMLSSNIRGRISVSYERDALRLFDNILKSTAKSTPSIFGVMNLLEMYKKLSFKPPRFRTEENGAVVYSETPLGVWIARKVKRLNSRSEEAPTHTICYDILSGECAELKPGSTSTPFVWEEARHADIILIRCMS